jgi:hypothetical protein
MSEYKDCYVAFLDILGFKNLLQNENCDAIKQIFDTIIDFEPHQLVKNRGAHNDVCYYIMSDSIVAYINSQNEDAFITLTEVCLQIQVKLLLCNPPVLLRGAIVKGPLFCEGKVIFGEGLSKAFILESTLAKYPRIIFTGETRNVALQNTGNLYVFDYNQMFYKKDDDMLYYINYLNTFDYIPSLKAKSVSEVIKFNNKYFEKLSNFIELILETETNPSIREKYTWLNNKVLIEIEHMPEVKKYFAQIERKQQAERNGRLNLALENGGRNNT